MKQITVKELLRLCALEIQKGNGDKNIVVGDDNEGNGYHGLCFGFTPVNGFEDDIYDSVTNSSTDTIILG